MTEQELRTSITPCIMSGNTWFVFEQIKAYAAAQVAAKDADLKRITHERDVLCEIRDMSYREIAALKADNARMREGILDIKGNPSKYFEEDYPLPEHPDRMQLKTNYVAFNALLSPADGRYQSICTKCEAAIEACECEFDGDDDANNHTKRVPAECLCSHTIDGRLAKQCDNCRNKPFAPADGGGVEETSAGGNMENPSFLIGAKCDDGEPVSLHIHHGNNGDFYPEIRYKDKKDGNWRRSPSPRISTSGGHNGPEILIAIANLYRALAGRGVEG